jgi:Mrp family chromosome partitioning ATPase
MSVVTSREESEHRRVAESQLQPQAADNVKVFSEASTEQYQLLLARLQLMGFGPGGLRRSVGFTSADRREGVTSVACNLALYAASCQEMRVLLVDANFLNPSLHRIFGLKQSPGLVELAHEHLIEDCITDLSTLPFKEWPSSLKSAYRRRRSFSRFVSSSQEATLRLSLSVLPVGGHDSALQNFSDPENEDFLKNVFSEFDLVVVDLPTVEIALSGGLTPAQLDGVVYVLQAESTLDATAAESVQQLQYGDASVLGVTFNQTKRHLPTWIDRRLGG